MEPTYIIFKLSDGKMACYGNYVDPIYDDESTYLKVLVDDPDNEMSLSPGTHKYYLDISDPNNRIVVEGEKYIQEESPTHS